MIILLLMLLLQTNVVYTMQEDFQERELHKSIYDKKTQNDFLEHYFPKLPAEVQETILGCSCLYTRVVLGSYAPLSLYIVNTVVRDYYSYIRRDYDETNKLKKLEYLINYSLHPGNPCLKSKYARENFGSIYSGLYNVQELVKKSLRKKQSDVPLQNYIEQTKNEALQLIKLGNNQSDIIAYYDIRSDFLKSIKDSANRSVLNISSKLISVCLLPLFALFYGFVFYAILSSITHGIFLPSECRFLEIPFELYAGYRTYNGAKRSIHDLKELVKFEWYDTDYLNNQIERGCMKIEEIKKETLK